MSLEQNFYSKVKQIDSILALRNIAADSEKLVISLITDDENLRSYFLKKVSDLHWFKLMGDNKYFDPKQIKFDKTGNALFWDILDYLERVSEQVVDNSIYATKLIKIIDDLVKFSIEEKEKMGLSINNYHIWWYCVKILNNLPAAIIKENLTVEKFKAWLSVWTDHSLGSDLTISDIGEKLLPKFLHSDFGPDYLYAEDIIHAITAIKTGGKTSVLTKRDNAVMAWQTYWIAKAFNKYGALIGQRCSLNVVFELADRLRKALEYKQKDHSTDLEIEGALYRLKVSRIFADGLKSGEIKFKGDEYECSVKKFSEDQLKGVDREKDFWAFHNMEPQKELKRFTFTALTRDSFISEIKNNLPNDINWQAADKLEKKILGIYEGLYADYSHIWCRSLKSGPEHGDGAEDILTPILRDVLLAKCEINREEGRTILSAFLNDNKYQFPLFRRFVLLCVDEFWSDYFGLLDKLIEVVPNLLEESDLEIEMQDVLRNHNALFSPELKAKIKSLIIDSVPEYYINKADKKLIAYWKYKWLSPLHENSYFSVLYKDAKEKTEPKDGKPYEPERSAFEGGFVTHKSPITKEDILQKPVAEIVKYLAEFKGADFRHGNFEGEPDKEGLSDVLKAAIKEDPKKFTDELEVFINTDYYYLQGMIRGLKEAWNSEKDLDWNNIFTFCLKYFSRDKDMILNEARQAQGEDSGEGRYIWIVEAIVELIGDGSRDDKRAFDPKYFDKAEQIFDLILPLLKGEKNPDTQRDALTYALNTTLGRTIMAYVSFSLRIARVKKEERSKNWGCDKFERFLPIGIDGYIWFGCYLPQMKYLDSDYVIKKIEFFEQKNSDDFEWQMFMEGYLTGSRIYKDLYDLMRKNYLTALGSTVFVGRADKRLVEHICIGYLQYGESLAQNNEKGQPSLFWKMLNEADAADKRDRWEEVAGFFWSISGRTLKKEEKENQEKPSEDFKKMVLAFWEWTVKEQELVKGKLGEKYNSFLSRMAELTIWLDKIDEITEKWLMLSAPFIEIDYRSSFFIEYLTKFDDEESVKRIGRIFLKVLENATPNFKKEDIQLLVERLYKVGEKDVAIKADADNICNTYGRRGIHFLKELFYKNQR